MARNFDTHRVAVTYRTARMAQRDAERLRSYGWSVRPSGLPDGRGHDPRVLLVDTYKPESLFGPADLPYTDKRPTTEEPPPGDERLRWSHACRRWDHGIVTWSTAAMYGACGCEPWRFATATDVFGIVADLQPIGADGQAFFAPINGARVERIEWPCRARDDRASVAITMLDGSDEIDGCTSWRGRSIMVAESAAVALLPGLTSAQRQCYIETGEIPAEEDTFPVGAA